MSTSPKYPIFIISKERWESRLTSKALEKMKVPYKIVIEPQEYENYAKVIDKENILVLPFSNLGQGSIPARNWVLDYARENNTGSHWLLDDNIRSFIRLNENLKIRCGDGTPFKVMEDFCDRYTNVKLAGSHYVSFVPRKKKVKALVINSRIYSCILIRNDIKHRWRGKYNEDTDLSLRVLKDGDCTILFRAFLQEKMGTLKMKGGNTSNVYIDGDKRFKFAQSLYLQHPDVVKIVQRFNRWHHQVDYRPFVHNKLIKKDGLSLSNTVNNYGLKLISL